MSRAAARMRVLVLVLVLALALTHPGAATAQPLELSAQERAAALKALESWLALVDDGDYAASWEEAAELFKSMVPEEEWLDQLTAARKPLGQLLMRDFVQADAAASLPGAPDGEYLVAVYKTNFVNKQGAVETVTVMRDPDGVWRTAGYFIR